MFDASLLNVLKPSQSLHKAPVRRTYLVLPSSIGLGRVRHISRLVGAARRCRCPRCVPDGRTVFGFAIVARARLEWIAGGQLIIVMTPIRAFSKTFDRMHRHSRTVYECYLLGRVEYDDNDIVLCV